MACFHALEGLMVTTEEKRSHLGRGTQGTVPIGGHLVHTKPDVMPTHKLTLHLAKVCEYREDLYRVFHDGFIQ